MPLNPLFFFNDTATTEIYTLSLHDALPISELYKERNVNPIGGFLPLLIQMPIFITLYYTIRSFESHVPGDRKSTRLNSSHANISYAVFCLKKKKTYHTDLRHQCRISVSLAT